MTSEVAAPRRQSVLNQKRRKPRRQSGVAVAFENKESVVQRSRLERTDSDKVIRRKSMERKMSVRTSIKLPQDFLDGLKGLDDSLTRMSLTGSVRGISDHQRRLSAITDAGEEPADDNNNHGASFTQGQIADMSKQALEMSDSDSEQEVDLEEPL